MSKRRRGIGAWNGGPHVATCKGCGAAILWVKRGDAWHPAEPTPRTVIVNGELVTGHESHTSRCSGAGVFKRQLEAE